MRIIAGKYRGKVLKSPKTDNVRPTTDRAKEALFNILTQKISNDWQNYSFLDVFAGTGAVGLEAFSRGAKNVGFIDINPINLMQNLQLFSQEEKSVFNVYKTSVEKLNIAHGQYDIIFLDAPYSKGLSEIAINNLLQNQWIKNSSIIVVETQKDEQLLLSDKFYITDERVYGLAKFYFLAIK